MGAHRSGARLAVDPFVLSEVSPACVWQNGKGGVACHSHQSKDVGAQIPIAVNLYPLRIESFISVGVACRRDGRHNRGYKPLPQVCRLHAEQEECNISFSTGITGKA